MKKILAVVIAGFWLSPVAEGMDYWNDFKGWVSTFWPRQQGQVSTAVPQEVAVVDTVNSKKRGREEEGPVVIDLTIGSDYGESDDDEPRIKRPACLDRINFNFGLVQNNGWECGYYSLFHCLALKNNRNLSQEEYDSFREHYKNFRSNKAVVFEQSYGQKQLLGEDFLQDLIESSGFREDVGIVTATIFFEELPIYIPIIQCINHVVRDRQPAWFIVGDNAHWVCLACHPTAVGACQYTCYDSIPGYAKGSAVFKKLFENIMNLCDGVVVVPPAAHYSFILKKIKKEMQKIEDFKNKPLDFLLDKLQTLQQEAIGNGFTEKTFSLLVRYVQSTVSALASLSSNTNPMN